MRSEILYLTDIVDAADAIARFTDGLRREEFLGDELRQSAVLQKLIVIGEAASRLAPAFQRQHPNVEWRKAAALRHIAVHEYFSVSWDIIWVTVTQNIPLLRSQVASVLTRLATDE